MTLDIRQGQIEAAASLPSPTEPVSGRVTARRIPGAPLHAGGPLAGDVRLAHLRAGDTSVVLALPSDGMPSVLHWGPDLGDLSEEDLESLTRASRPWPGDSPVYTQVGVSVLPQHSAGWLGRPGLTGSRSGRAWSVRVADVRHSLSPGGERGPARDETEAPAGAVRVESTGTDPECALEVATDLELHPSGLLRLRARVRNLSPDPYEVVFVEPALPVPDDAAELLDMAGRHTSERVPQRRPFDVGAWVRESRGGRPGHDSPTLLCAGVPGFRFRSGRTWGVHLAWSGNQVFCAERTSHGWRLLRAGELLLPGEVVLGEGETYTSPWLVASWGDGLDALAGRIHAFLRARPSHPRRPRPVLLNTWEAVYFDQDAGRLLDLAETAASVGIERFVLDDGWFRGRSSDRAGLGDWYVDESVWPRGLHPLADRVHALGMEFGLWFEPEMINLDSDLARAHPEWILATEHGPGVASRYQHVLDLGCPEAFAYLLERISALVGEYGIAYLKWDHNRPLVDAGQRPSGRPGIHGQNVALYRLLAELKARHPGLEIESCAGGGGRIDLGILEFTDRIWASDCIDAHERARIQRWTSLLLPPELVGTHIGSPGDHTTKRRLDLSFRAGTAVWGHLGIEWDLTKAGSEDLDALRTWIAFHKQTRALLHSGTVVHADSANPSLQLDGVVAGDRRDALFSLSCLGYSLQAPLGRVTLPGLDPDVHYAVIGQAPAATYAGLSGPDWLTGGVTLPGRVLAEVGVQAPLLHPDHLVLIRARAAAGD